METYEQYNVFADHVNSLIRLLNREGKLGIPELDKSSDMWGKISNTIEKYGPLINNYNEVVLKAREFEKGNKAKEEAFGIAIGKFGLETALIVAFSTHKFVFGAVGEIYFSSGLNRLALTCPTCVSIALSTAYWSLKTYLVEEASNALEWLYPMFKNYIPKNSA